MGLGLFFLAALGMGLHATNRGRIGLSGFESRTQALIDRSASLAERAIGFDEEAALRALGDSPINGPVYRFDERWREAGLLLNDAATSPSGLSPNPGVFLEFEEDDTHHFDPEYSSFHLQDGVLRTRYEEGKTLRTVEPFEIPWDDAASVRFKMKLERGEHVEFAFARGLISDRGRIWDAEMGLITVDVVADGEFHTYEVNIRDAFQPDFGGIARIQRLFFRPSNVEGDEVEIEFIHILRRKAKYQTHPLGSTYETLNKDTRPVLTMATPFAVSYEVTIPSNQPLLRMGLGMLEPGDPVTFEVKLKDGDDTELLLSETVAWSDRWIDREPDISAWAGRTVDLEFTATSEGGNIAFWSNPVLQGAPNRRFNVVLLLEDTLRADHLSIYGHDRSTSPVKEQLAAEGVVFETAFSQATETRPSCPTLMTSLYPTSTGVYYFTNQLSDRYLTLAEILRSQGFKTGAFIQNNQAGRIAGLHQGYSHFFERYNLEDGPRVVYNERLEAWLDDYDDRNFFLYLHILDPHDPYDPPAPFDAWSKEPSREHPGEEQQGFELDRSRYDGEILNNDTVFGEFIADLKERGVYDDTLIVVVSDHGEFFGEHGGLRFHIPPAYAQVVHVPLLLRYPKGLPQGRRVRTPVGLIDVMPTILDLAGIGTEPLLLQGDSLIPILESDNVEPDLLRPVVTDDVRDLALGDSLGWGALLFGNWHLINSPRFVDEEGENPGATLLPKFFRMQAFNYGEDPEGESRDRAFALDPLIKRRVQRQLDELQSTNALIRQGITRGEESESSYDPETLERLRRLGYIK
jgi:hypothetical protein